MKPTGTQQTPRTSNTLYYPGMVFAYLLDKALGFVFTAQASTTPSEDALHSALQYQPRFFCELYNITDKIHADFLNSEFITLDEFKTAQLNHFIYQVNKTPKTSIEKIHYEDAFKTVLLKHLQEKSRINVSSYMQQSVEKKSTSATNINTPLAYLWKDYERKGDESMFNRFFNEMSDAHGLIQVMGWSTQNENSLLAIFDYYNYIRYRKNVAEARSILFSLINPFYPLFTEYQNIAHREKNIVLKILRTATPMLITAGFVIGITALIPVALPELAFLLLAIPLVYLGLALASLYVKTKDFLYQSYRYLMYQGDLNQFPEFQLNHRLTSLFGDIAEEIRHDYIQAIQTCDTLENTYRQKEIFSAEDEKARKANMTNRNMLILEWFDLRNNTKLNIDQIFNIALERPIQQFKSAQTHDNSQIKILAHTMAIMAASLQTAPHEGDEPAPPIAPNLRFFPTCLEHREKIMRLQEQEKQFTPK